MIQTQLKLKLTKKQEQECLSWLPSLASIYNFAIRKIELNARDKIYFSQKDFQNLLAGHSKTMGIPSHIMQGILSTAHMAWDRCFKKKAGKPRFKGARNRFKSIPFPDHIKRPEVKNRIKLLGLGSVKFHKQEIPEGRIKCARVVKRASGWYLCLFIDAFPKAIKRVASGIVGIDPGFKDLLTLSTGEKIAHPRELEESAKRLAQAQRGHDKQLAARISERIGNQRKDRNHKLSRRLVSENVKIVFSKDNVSGIAKKFGKSVTSSGHSQLRQMLGYKSRIGGTEYVEVDSRNSTRTCSNCWSLTGPTGWTGLSVRRWCCTECRTSHDRDVNAAINTLLAGAGSALERDAIGIPSGTL